MAMKNDKTIFFTKTNQCKHIWLLHCYVVVVLKLLLCFA